MGETMIYLVLFASLCVNALAIEGVKGGHRPRYPTSGSQHGGVNNATDTGLCYKRVPYNQILTLNATGAMAHNTIPVPQPGTQTDVEAGWITILDCCDGFKRNATTSKCEFHCQDGCFGGRCTGPNVCSCEPGWFPDKGVCMPYCSKPCQKDAYCFTPETCICKLGYDDANGQCKPICPGGCKNGECIAPRLCRCKPGYMLNDLQECIPVCEGGCPHGDCTSPGVCTCYEGYVNPPTDKESCVPHCPGNCNDGGDCISPGVCNCRQGFDRDPTGTCVAKIIPLTPNDQCRCGPNGVCIAPNTCQCRPGYSLNRNTGECIPSTNSSQSSYCEKPCLNGDCTGYNQCTCKHGYVLDQTDHTRTRCVPVCLNGCVNGVCSAPNFCICNQGYVKDRSVKGSQRCIPQTSRV